MRYSKVGFRSQLNIVGFIMVVPALIIFSLFKIWPIIWGIILSLYKWDGLTEMEFIGFDNFHFMLTQDKLFPQVISNTLIYAVGIIAGNILIGL